MNALQKALLSTTALALVGAVPAVAQTTYNWTGPFIGANLGLIEHKNRAIDIDSYFSFPGQTYGLRRTGLLGGIQAGYNYQAGVLVVGAEIDANFASTANSRTFATPFSGPAHHATALRSLFTGRLRAGFAVDNLLIYATGGAAFAEIRNHMADLGNPGVVWGNTAFRTGWIAGVGAEYAFSNRWRVKAEILFADFGTQTYAINFGNAGQYRFAFRNKATIARAGVNYAF